MTHGLEDGGGGSRPPQASVAAVRLPTTGLRHELRATSVVWRRDVAGFARDRARAFVGFVQPMLFLFVLGTGLSSALSRVFHVDFRTFLFPGILCISVLFTATFAGVSVVWDREHGFLREMMVAPVGSSSILVGKALGGATVGTLQSSLLLVLSGMVDVPYDPLLFLQLVGLLFLAGLMLTALGLAMVVRIRRYQSAFPVVQMTVMPMMFLSGAMFPLARLPDWLDTLTVLNPLTYAVQPMRRVVFDQLAVSEVDRRGLDPGLTWGAWEVPVAMHVVVMTGVTVLLMTLAIARFDRTD